MNQGCSPGLMWQSLLYLNRIVDCEIHGLYGHCRYEGVAQKYFNDLGMVAFSMSLGEVC